MSPGRPAAASDSKVMATALATLTLTMVPTATHLGMDSSDRIQRDQGFIRGCRPPAAGRRT